MHTGLWSLENTAGHYYIPGAPIRALHWVGTQQFVQPPAFNRLIIFGISIPLSEVYESQSSCAHHGWPAARKREQLSCPNWTEGS